MDRVLPSRDQAALADKGGADTDHATQLLRLLEHLRERVAKIDAYANAANDLVHQFPWGVDRAHRRDFNRLAHFVSDAAQAASAALDDSEQQLRAVLKTSRLITSSRPKATQRAAFKTSCDHRSKPDERDAEILAVEPLMPTPRPPRAASPKKWQHVKKARP